MSLRLASLHTLPTGLRPITFFFADFNYSESFCDRGDVWPDVLNPGIIYIKPTQYPLDYNEFSDSKVINFTDTE